MYIHIYAYILCIVLCTIRCVIKYVANHREREYSIFELAPGCRASIETHFVFIPLRVPHTVPNGVASEPDGFSNDVSVITAVRRSEHYLSTKRSTQPSMRSAVENRSNEPGCDLLVEEIKKKKRKKVETKTGRDSCCKFTVASFRFVSKLHAE